MLVTGVLMFVQYIRIRLFIIVDHDTDKKQNNQLQITQYINDYIELYISTHLLIAVYN
jgi:hypothetical protein